MVYLYICPYLEREILLPLDSELSGSGHCNVAIWNQDELDARKAYFTRFLSDLFFMLRRVFGVNRVNS